MAEKKSSNKVRARDDSGAFIADDPTTEKNEAWVSLSANEINKRRLKELNASIEKEHEMYPNGRPSIGRPLQELLAENLDDDA